jgi:hypothetical protein
MPRISVTCPKCGRMLLGATTEMIGDVGVCVRCRTEFEILATRPAGGSEIPEIPVQQGPWRWRALRVVFTLLFLLGGLGFFNGVSMAITSHLWPRSYRQGNMLLVGTLFAVLLIWLIGSALLSRMAARRMKRIYADEPFTKELVAVSVAALVALVFGAVIPEWVSGISLLVAVFGSLYVVLKCKTFRWRNYFVAGLAPGLVCLPIWVGTFMRAQELAWISQRTEVFRATITDVATLFAHDDLVKAMASPKTVGAMPDLGDSVLVLDAESENRSAIAGLSVSELDAFVPQDSSVKQPDSVHVVVILGKIGPEINSFFELPENAPLVAPVLVYRWPEKQLARTAKLTLGCNASDPQHKVYQKGADSLMRLLREKAE